MGEKGEVFRKEIGEMEIVLETDRLILRHFLVDDLDDLYRIYTQPGTMRYIGSGRCPVIRT